MNTDLSFYIANSSDEEAEFTEALTSRGMTCLLDLSNVREISRGFMKARIVAASTADVTFVFDFEYETVLEVGAAISHGKRVCVIGRSSALWDALWESWDTVVDFDSTEAFLEMFDKSLTAQQHQE